MTDREFRDYYVKLQANPYYWIRKYVRTADPKDLEYLRTNPEYQITGKPWRHEEYLEKTIQIVHNDEDGLIADAKSRQIRKTWLYCAYFLHQAMFFAHRKYFIQSLNADDANELIRDRCWFIYEHLPEWMRKIHPATKIYNQIDFTGNGSVLQGLPVGDKMRGKVGSGGLIDEGAKWNELGLCLEAAIPATKGKGCKLVVVSSAAPGAFEALVYDRDKTTNQKMHYQRKRIMQGLETTKNAKNGFTVIWSHYTADSTKRTEEWKTNEKKGLPPGASWEQEYEIQFEAKSGEKIFGEFVPSIGGNIVKPLDPEFVKQCPIYCILDSGLRHPCAILWICIAPEDISFVFAEHYLAGKTVKYHKEAIRKIEDEWGIADLVDYRYADPDIFKRSPIDANTVANEYSKKEYIGKPKKEFEHDWQYEIEQENPANWREGYIFERARNDVAGRNRIKEMFEVDPLIGYAHLYIAENCPNTIYEVTNLRHVTQTERMSLTHNDSEAEVDKDNHTTDDLKYYANLEPVYWHKTPIEKPDRLWQPGEDSGGLVEENRFTDGVQTLGRW